MKFGVCVPNYGETCSTEALQQVALAAEENGYDSVWCTDHILLSRNSNTPYERIFDSITTLAYLSARTSKVRLGVSSLITAMRNPVVVAKQLATIDYLSNGRVMLATSAGWNEEEFRNLGSDFHNRGKRLDQSIKLIRTLWNAGSSFESKALPQKFQDAVFEPAPIQKHLTIWIAGSSKAAMRRAARLGDGWHPNVEPLDQFAPLVKDFRDSFPEAREKPISARIGVNVKAEKSEYVSARGQRRVILSSDMKQNRALLERLDGLGVSYLVLVPSPDGRVTVPDQIASLSTIAREFL
jgi:probable F420-dependent oxidoreductase